MIRNDVLFRSHGYDARETGGGASEEGLVEL